MQRSLMLTLGCALVLGAKCDRPADREPAQKTSGEAKREAAVPAPEPREELIPVGEPAPDFESVDQAGNRIVLHQLVKDKNVVLIFYPADFTPGCTKQLCNVRDDWSKFQEKQTMVLGVNPASVSRHADFAKEYKLEFPVISDTGARIASGYGAAGQNPEHPQRTVYVIRKGGKVAFAERGMVPHEKVFAAIDQ